MLNVVQFCIKESSSGNFHYEHKNNDNRHERAKMELLLFLLLLLLKLQGKGSCLHATAAAIVDVVVPPYKSRSGDGGELKPKIVWACIIFLLLCCCAVLNT